MTIIRHTTVTPLGDTVHTRREYNGTRLAREDITLTGPPELIDMPRGGNSGRDIYQRDSKPEREIWHVPGRYP